MKQKWFNIGISIMVAALLLAGLYVFNAANQPETRGTQHFGNVTLGEGITSLELFRGVIRTYDGTDYYEDIDVGDVPGTANNGMQIAYKVTDWSGETAMTAIMAQVMVTAPITQSEAYGGDFMARFYDVVGTGTATGIGMFGEVIATYTSTVPYGYAIYGQLDTAGTGDNSITDGSVFYADLYGDVGDFGTVDVLSLRTGDTYDYGINLSGATAISVADIVFQNGTELEEVTDTVLTFSEFLAAEEQTVVEVYASLWITPTGTNTPITATGEISLSCDMSVYTGSVDGQLLIVTNIDDTDTITVCDGALTNLSGHAVLGPQDTLTMMWNDMYTVWLELAQANN